MTVKGIRPCDGIVCYVDGLRIGATKHYDGWRCTELTSGLSASPVYYKTMSEALQDVLDNARSIKNILSRRHFDDVNPGLVPTFTWQPTIIWTCRPKCNV